MPNEEPSARRGAWTLAPPSATLIYPEHLGCALRQGQHWRPPTWSFHTTCRPEAHMGPRARRQGSELGQQGATSLGPRRLPGLEAVLRLQVGDRGLHPGSVI